MKNLFLGIDPGINGGLAIVGGDSVITSVMPATENELNVRELASFLMEHAPQIKHCVLEHVWSQPGTAAGASFKFGKVNGLIEAVLVMLNIPYTMVIPRTWMKVMHEGTSKSLDTKARGFLVCQRLFPDVNLIQPRCRKQHDGVSDALLMAEYCRRKHG